MKRSKAGCWTINGRFLSQKLTGVQRYAHEIVRAMDALLKAGHPLGQKLEIELLLPPSASGMPDLKAIKCRLKGPLSGYLWEQITLPMGSQGNILSLCNTGPIFSSSQVICIHDANTRVVPESYSLAFRSAYRVLLPLLGRTAAAVATVSRSSADQIARFGIARRDRLIIAPDGFEHVLKWRAADEEPLKPVENPNTIVLLGSQAPHKNIRIVLDLADELFAHGLRLAVVGDVDKRVFNSTALQSKAANVNWLGALPDSELPKLFNDSLCLAFPSMAEGFGLPPLEAMALGCPVVVSDRTSLPEICGDAALYASPDQPAEWMRAFLLLRSNPELRKDLSERGRSRARLFSWTDSARTLLETMARISDAGALASQRVRTRK